MFRENLQLAFAAIWANKTRAFLTTLGIVIGVAAVIAIVALVQGLTAYLQGAFQELGATYVRVAPEFSPGETGLHRIRLTMEDAEALKRSLPQIEVMTPLVSRIVPVRHRDETKRLIVIGSNENYPEVVNHQVEYGRFFSSVDIEHRKNVCIVGLDVIKDLKIEGDPLGKEIRVSGERFLVVGILERKGDFLGVSRDSLVFIPIEKAFALFGREFAETVVVDMKVRSEELVESLRDQATELLRARHGLKPAEPNDFRVILQGEALSVIGKILGFVTLAAAGIVGISLVVGGIGIMNIMLVSVTERTREIGLRKAVGARRQDILTQFLIEAVALSGTGGLAGVLAGFALGHAVSALIPAFPEAHIPFWAVLLGFGFSSAVGLFFGIYPAVRASALDPIEALRRE
jgi:putative ABC transport system permease protein